MSEENWTDEFRFGYNEGHSKGYRLAQKEQLRIIADLEEKVAALEAK
jgi:hypothetical protein